VKRTQFLPLNGPRGTYSHFWMSLALQSFINTTPKMCRCASPNRIGDTRSFPGPIKAACAQQQEEACGLSNFHTPVLCMSANRTLCIPQPPPEIHPPTTPLHSICPHSPLSPTALSPRDISSKDVHPPGHQPPRHLSPTDALNFFLRVEEHIPGSVCHSEPLYPDCLTGPCELVMATEFM